MGIRGTLRGPRCPKNLKMHFWWDVPCGVNGDSKKYQTTIRDCLHMWDVVMTGKMFLSIIFSQRDIGDLSIMAAPSDGGVHSFSNQNATTHNSSFGVCHSSCRTPILRRGLLFHLGSYRHLRSVHHLHTTISNPEEPPGKAPRHGASIAKGLKCKSTALRKPTSQSDQHQLPPDSC